MVVERLITLSNIVRGEIRGSFMGRLLEDNKVFSNAYEIFNE